MPDAFGKLAELYIGQTRAFDAVLDRGTHTLIHGDAHLGNLFLDGDRVGFLDWACFARAPGMRDVAYFLCNSLPTELRRAEERDLLLRYQRALDAAGAPTRPFDAIWRDYRRFAAYSWVAATTTAAAGSRMQSVAVGRRALQRSNAAIEDLGTLPLLFEELDVRSGG
jgi:Ser/Thr protein kinase RdoA (MazF antagonist)